MSISRLHPVASLIAVLVAAHPAAALRAADEPAPVSITVDTAAGRLPISPYLFGKNNGVSDLDPAFVRDVGLRIARDSNGNNCTKYNWKADLSSHPDWYNNVYPQGLHTRAAKLSSAYGDLQALYGLQVLGFVAKAEAGSGVFNFTERDGKPADPSAPGGNKNLCAGGDASKYTIPWTPKDTVDLLDHWFLPKPAGLGLDRSHFRYFHLDNEPECWSSTHDDVCPKPMTAEECVQKYVAVAKELRTRYPDVRILAPGFTGEWFWWNWADGKGVDHRTWLEFFLKRMGEESKAFGKPLIDVVDFHTYVPGDLSDADLLQQWRIFYDKAYACPSANGVKRYPDGGWHDDQRVEDLFGRTEQWLDQYFGKGNPVRIGITECGPGERKPVVTALWYASMLGTFADHGVEVFTPWEWQDGWWEVLHLFSRHGQPIRVQATSSDQAMVSAYASVNEVADAMTVILVNREPSASRRASLHIDGFTPKPGDHQVLTLSDIPEPGKLTFHSATDNGIKRRKIGVVGPSLNITLPAYSITAVELVR